MSWTQPHLTRVWQCPGLDCTCGSCMGRFTLTSCQSQASSHTTDGPRSKIKMRSKARSDFREAVSHATEACISSNRIDFDDGEANVQCRWPFHSPTLRLPCEDLLEQSVTPVQVVCMFIHSGEIMTTLLPLCLALPNPVQVSLYPVAWDYCANDGIIDMYTRWPHGPYAGLHRTVLHAHAHEGRTSLNDPICEPGSHVIPTFLCWRSCLRPY